MSKQLGCLVKERYQVQQIFKQTLLEVTYIVQDNLQYGKNYFLREFISAEVGKAAVVGESFQKQLSKIQTLKHPQIQQIDDFFWDNENLFIVQSYIAGQSYQNWIQNRSPLTELEAIELLNQILPVLSYLHCQQIIHRDISGSNILLRSRDNLPVLINFGILTDILIQMVGEPPEITLLARVRKLSGIIIPPGTDEDLYALAVTLVMLLTSQTVEVLFNSQTQTWEWENWKLVSDQLTSVLNRMLAVQPINRFDSADEVLHALNTPLAVTVPVPPPIFSTTSPSSTPLNQSPIYSPSQQPTELSLPNINTFSQPITFDTTPLGSQNWLKAVIGGIVIGLCVIGAGFWWFTRQRSSDLTQQISVASPTSSPTATNSSPSASLAATPSTNNLGFSPSNTTNRTAQSAPLTPISQQDAINLVNAWLQAKREMFAPPYNRKIAAEITTSKLYNRTAGPNGTIDWLQNNNAKYEYGVQKIEGVNALVPMNELVGMQVKVTEQRTLLKDGKVDHEQSDFNTITVTYYFQFVNGRWKIVDSKIVN